jgi:hypothetical protein
MESLRDKYLSLPKTQADTEVDPSSYKDTFDVEWSEDTSSALDILSEPETPSTLAIRDDNRFRSFEPAADPSILTIPAYSDSFGELIKMAREIVDASIDDAKRS